VEYIVLIAHFYAAGFKKNVLKCHASLEGESFECWEINKLLQTILLEVHSKWMTISLLLFIMFAKCSQDFYSMITPWSILLFINFIKLHGNDR
jgi:hypothetical protein